ITLSVAWKSRPSPKSPAICCDICETVALGADDLETTCPLKKFPVKAFKVTHISGGCDTLDVMISPTMIVLVPYDLRPASTTTLFGLLRKLRGDVSVNM